jgi:hypothetical protein
MSLPMLNYRSGNPPANANSYPTLTDLHFKVSELVGRLGYEKRIEDNIRAAMETRIGSLRTGGKVK